MKRTLAALVLAGGLVLGLSACGGSAPATASPTTPTLDQAREQVQAEASAAAEAKARAKAGLCTETGNKSEFTVRMLSMPSLDTPAGIEALRDYIAWLKAAPEGCTRDARSDIARTIEAMEDTLAKRG